MAPDSSKNRLADLHSRAQALLTSHGAIGSLSSAETTRLVHELDTCQIELELQNEDLRQAQEQLEHSHRRYLDLYDFAPVGYLTINKKGMIVEVNLTASEMLGLARKSLLNQPFSQFIAEKDQDIHYLSRKKLLETKEVQSYELQMRKQDGSLFYAQLKSVASSAVDGDSGQFRIILINTSQQQQTETMLRASEERYQSIVMDQYDLICRFDPQGRITFVNDAYCDCFSVQSQEILGTNFLPHIHRDDLPLIENQFKNLTPKQPKKTVAHRVILADGSIRWQQWSGRALFNDQGKVLEYQSVGRDITELKETEAALREAGSQLEQRVQERTMELSQTHQQLLHAEKLSAVGALAASIAHEFNNPMQGILTVLSGIARRTPLEKEDLALAHSAIKECKRIKELVRDLQDFNRPTSGKRVVMNLIRSIDSLLLLCRSDYKQRKIRLVTDYAEDTPQVIAVPDQIKQVFLNLLNNAADACPDGGTIQISIQPHGDRVEVEVRDNGVGIPPADLGRIFEPFFTTKLSAKGNGLGLSVSRAVIEKHHGSIEVESEPGAGTTFRITLPVGGGFDEA